MRLAGIFALVLSGCATYQPELMVGCGSRMAEGHLEGACELRVTQRFGDRGFCSLSHSSEPQDGRGGDESEPDVSVDHAQCGVRWGGGRR